jgi:4'-phosphopantetheinyl transferase
LHGLEQTGIVPRTVQCDDHGWSRRSLAAVAGITPTGEPSLDAPPSASAVGVDVDLWLARLDDLGASEGEPVGPSGIDESARAARIADPVARSRYLASRRLLRGILAQRLKRQPDTLEFEVSHHGKPRLVVEDGPALHFNLSHAGGWLLIATRVDGPIGVDLEFPRDGIDLGRLARRVFSPAEQAGLQRATERSAAAGQRWFFGCWTRKEALLKCLGTGFAGGASAFEVGVEPTMHRVSTPGHGCDSVCVNSLELPELTAAPARAHAAVAWSSQDLSVAAPRGPGDGAILRYHWVDPTA